jgi:hypothetical protein
MRAAAVLSQVKATMETKMKRTKSRKKECVYY